MIYGRVDPYFPPVLTREQCGTLFELLKPVGVNLNSNGSNRYEALLNVEELVTFISIRYY